MSKVKTDLEIAFLALKHTTIKKVWYKGVFSINTTYHAIQEGIFIQCTDGEVFHIYTADELKLGFLQGVYIKRIRYWEREKKYFKKIYDASLHWQPYLGEEITSVFLNWKLIYKSKPTLGNPKSNTDYPHDVELHFRNEKDVSMAAIKIIDKDTDPILGFPQLTLFFDKKERDKWCDMGKFYQ
ncbi:hypothetical protein [Aquimarina megaterium]|uniref:hypothetical protein n=1 Tax=Aquimarina megaterium TaxID=1443666 RepID=UPI000944EC09|nr:hypothetical protein [Aquimarina megaterium]